MAADKTQQRSADNGRVALREIGSIPLASADPEALRTWYERAFDVHPDAVFLPFGVVDLLITGRDDVAVRNPEPGRGIINIQVDDAQATARHLDAIGAEWLAKLEFREPDGAWFRTVFDPDGNYVQIIELTEAYWAGRRLRQRQEGTSALEVARVNHCGSGAFALFESSGRPPVSIPRWLGTLMTSQQWSANFATEALCLNSTICWGSERLKPDRATMCLGRSD